MRHWQPALIADSMTVENVESPPQRPFAGPCIEPAEAAVDTVPESESVPDSSDLGDTALAEHAPAAHRRWNFLDRIECRHSLHAKAAAAVEWVECTVPAVLLALAA